MPGRVDRCVCCERMFSELYDVARSSGARTVEELQQVVEFGTGCGTCIPYVEIVLATGQTVLPLLGASQGHIE